MAMIRWIISLRLDIPIRTFIMHCVDVATGMLNRLNVSGVCRMQIAGKWRAYRAQHYRYHDNDTKEQQMGGALSQVVCPKALTGP